MLFSWFKKKKTSINTSNANSVFELPRHLFWHLLISQLLTVLLFVNELQLWMLGLIALCLLWRISIARERLQKPNKFTVILLAVSGAVLIALTSQSLGLLLSMIHLINFAFIMKAMEIKARKDFFQIVLIGLFLHACSLIFAQSIWFSLIVVAIIFVNLSLLYRFFAPTSEIKSAYTDTAKYALFSIPLAAALFVFFPRISPFWQMPVAKSAQTGLGDTVQPGDIAQLARSEELAFRVEFDSYVPSMSDMYWRAMTMSDYDGRKWQRTQRQWVKKKGILPDGVDSNTPLRYDYQLIAEPSYRRWLFALDTAQINNSDINQLTDFSLVYDKPITKSISYRVTSFPTAIKNPELGRYLTDKNLRIPADSNPELTELGRSLAEQYTRPQDIIDHVINEFRQQDYYYTLAPPQLVNNSLDQFFFETRRGFCEHYASSFTYLMRAAGIPARLVTGYLGGEYNAQGNYYSIYQYNAHAWSEVWLEGQGWVTVDPTAAVNPARVSDDMSTALRLERNALAASNWRWFNQSTLWLQFKMQIDAIDYQWTRLIVGYNMDRQHAFLSELFGRDSFIKGILVITATFIAVVFGLWGWGLYQARTQYAHIWQKPLENTLLLLEDKGITRQPSESLVQLIAQVKSKLPDVAESFAHLAYRYQSMQYADNSVNSAVKNGSNKKGQPDQVNQMEQAKAFSKACHQFNRQLKAL